MFIISSKIGDFFSLLFYFVGYYDNNHIWLYTVYSIRNVILNCKLEVQSNA